MRGSNGADGVVVGMRQRRALVFSLLFGLSGLILCGAAWGSGPRYVTGPPFFTGYSGVAIGWKQPNLLYYTDAGDLSATVNHAAADAMVAAAAGVWNLPVASITLGQGGMLAEHVTGQMVYLDASGMELPADVMSSNAAAVPIAVIYDTDGSVTDSLLGGGASDPSGCRGNSVFESVDQFDPAGYITHAVIVMNGRCTGTAPEMQVEMRYQLMRVFGRVLGLAWSQLNDNVFTGVPTPTYDQAAHWPILHPLDILCGPFSFECLPNPFQLRADDVASMVLVYPIREGSTLAAGKQASLAQAHEAEGTIRFPTGQGMSGVNVVLRRVFKNSSLAEGWYESSAVTGTNFRRTGVPPFAQAVDNSVVGSLGSFDPGWLGHYKMAYVPIPAGDGGQSVQTSIEAVNPLYAGPYSLGPYAAGDVQPSGSNPRPQLVLGAGQGGGEFTDFLIADAAGVCGAGTDGTAAVPAQIAPSGWWTGLLCGYGHSSYAGVDVQAGRTLTVEVTALDEAGLATLGKAMPAIALYGMNDAPNDSPSLGLAPTAFQANGLGTTALNAATGTGGRIRIGIADQRGDGRPDFKYQARLFLADDLAPANLPAGGGSITITGFGFRGGNQVLVNGVAVTVSSVTPNTMVALVPAMSVLGASSNTALDVEVLDGGTGADSVMSGVLLFDATPVLAKVMRVLSAPSGTIFTGDATTVPFAVQVFAGDGATPVAGETVVFAANSTGNGNAAKLGVCGAGTCTVATDTSGIASTPVTALAVGLITLQASAFASGNQAADGVQTVSFTAIVKAASMHVLGAPGGTLLVGQQADTPVAFRVFGPDGAALPGRAITFSVLAGSATYSTCSAATCQVVTDGSGTAFLFVTPTAAGSLILEAADGSVTQTVSLTAATNLNVLQIIVAPTAAAHLNEAAGGFFVRLLAADGRTPVSGRIIFSAPAGITFAACATNVCPMDTNQQGEAGTGIGANQLGTFTIQAAFGDVVRTATFTVTARTMQLRVVSAPSGDVPVGTVAASPFTAEVIGLDGVTPQSGVTVTLEGIQDEVIFTDCRKFACLEVTDSNGMVSSPVLPLRVGPIRVDAVFAPFLQTASFTSVGQLETMRVLSEPGPAGALVGDAATFTVQIIEGDGVTPAAGKPVQFTAARGSLVFVNCGYATCGSQTDENGIVSIQGVASEPGRFAVQVTDLVTTQTMSYLVTPKPDRLRLLSAPGLLGEIVPIDTPASTVFAVQVLLQDGVTGIPGRNVTVSVTEGARPVLWHAGEALDACCRQTPPEWLRRQWCRSGSGRSF